MQIQSQNPTGSFNVIMFHNTMNHRRIVCSLMLLAVITGCQQKATPRMNSRSSHTTSRQNATPDHAMSDQAMSDHAMSASDAPTSATVADGFVNYDRTADEFKAEIDNHLTQAERLLDEILAVKDQRNVKNTIEPANEMYRHLSNAGEQSSLFGQSHPDKTVRETADVAMQQVSSFGTRLSLNRDLYEAFKSIDVSNGDAELQRLMFKTMREFRRSGVDRDEATRKRIEQLQEETVKLSQTFSNNIRGDVRSIKLDSPSDLAGLPQDYIDAHAPGQDGKITITTEYPDYIPFAKYAQNTDARREIYKEYRRRGYPDNLETLDQLIRKRYEIAQLLGYKNWADYITEDKMIGSATAVDNFINRIATLSKDPADRDMKMLLDEKQKDVPDATTVADYERSFYAERVKADQFNFDSQQTRPYFEFSRVQQGLFDVTSKLFGLQYRPVTNVKLWHEDVTCWDLYDGDRHVGRFMLDLHPRDGKYKHAACFGYQEGIAGKQIPISVLVCNFPKPTADAQPALMEHNQVVTFFHEFGHLLHALLSGHHQWIGISGISTEWDFVEAPSQMLEEWCWDLETLRIFAKHYESNEPIPADLVKRMRIAQEFGKGINVRQQMLYAAISLNFHNRDPQSFDTTEMLKELTGRYAPSEYVEDTYMHCSFGHLTGYSAIYYTYMWSLVIAKDMFSEFQNAGLYNNEVAHRYRATVLEPGGAKAAAMLVKDFLHRDYSFDAYGRWLKSDPKPGS